MKTDLVIAGLSGLLTIFFSLAAANCLGLIHCSWWWITLPFWLMPLCLFALGGIYLLALAFQAISTLIRLPRLRYQSPKSYQS